MMDTELMLPAAIADDVAATIAEWKSGGLVARLWDRDATLWTGDDEASWLDWLTVIDEGLASAGALSAFAEAAASRFDDAVVLGMGGSSLCPDVLARTFGPRDGFPRLSVLDSTDPAQIRSTEAAVAVERTLFIVSSKSGTTLEPNILRDYFFARVKAAVGAERAPDHFIIITDPGSKLSGAGSGGSRVFPGVPGIGGRYSALSNFGMVPAAVMGLDVAAFLERARVMREACAAGVPVDDNPGLVLGVVLGECAKAGHDKLTIVCSPEIEPLGAWLEQLVAESTGKDGKGIIPIDREPLGEPSDYGCDRIFVYLRLEGSAGDSRDGELRALVDAGHPVVRVDVAHRRDLGQEFFRWEFATAVAGAVMGINPFNQPDVERSKVLARELTDAYEASGSLPPERPFFDDGELALFADATNREAIEAAARERSPSGLLAAHLGRVETGDYVALLAYCERNAEHDAVFQSLRVAVRDRFQVATAVGFGPRFLHSTGQAYKGGPNSGVFIQITCDDAQPLAVPGRQFDFGVAKAAQARGDLMVLDERGRRSLRVHLRGEVGAGLRRLRDAVAAALALEKSSAP